MVVVDARDGASSCGPSSASRSSASPCARPRSRPSRAGSWASAWAGCTRWAGASPRASAPSRGMMIAPIVFLTPTMMQTVLIYAFAAAVLGGIESPVGAVVGGLLIGVGTTLLGATATASRSSAASARPPAAERVRRADPRAALPPGGPVRQGRGEARLMPSWLPKAIGYGARRGRRRRCIPQFVHGFRIVEFTYVGDVHGRARRPRHPHRDHRADLARPGRLHGARRVHDGDPVRRSRLAGARDHPGRRARRRRRRLPVRLPGAAALAASTSRSRRSRSR